MDRFIPCRNTVLFIGLLWLTPAVRGGQQTSAPSKTGVALEPGKAIERAVAGGDAHEYTVALTDWSVSVSGRRSAWHRPRGEAIRPGRQEDRRSR